MYNMREELYERDADNSRQCGNESILSTAASQLRLLEPVFPCPIERPEDDSAARELPSRHVDYLSHEWTEEDVWSSYKFVRSKRKMYPNSIRLENASWRTWEQKRRSLKTVSPETVKWLKDHDVTWLYGPLQTATGSSGRFCQASNFGYDDRKSCLKKRSLSEIMLLRSVSSASLVRQATEKKQKYRDFILPSNPGLTRSSTTLELSDCSSDAGSSPSLQNSWLSKSVKFHDQVEQRIAVAHFGEDEPEYHYVRDDDMTRNTKTMTKQWVSSAKSRKNTLSFQTIEKLPHASLKSAELSRQTNVGLGISHRDGKTRRSPLQLEASLFENDFEEVGDDYWTEPMWLPGSREGVQILQDKLEALKMDSGDNATIDLSCSSLFMGPTLAVQQAKLLSQVSSAIEGNKFSQLASFSFQSFTSTTTPEYSSVVEEESCWSADIDFSTTGDSDFYPLDPDSQSDSVDGYEHIDSVPVLSSAQTALISRVMEEFWVVFNAKDFARSPVHLSTPASVLPRGGKWGLSTFSSQSPTTNLETTPPCARALAEHEQSLRQSLPLFVKKTVENLVREEQHAGEASIIARLSAIIQDCQDKVLAAYQSEDYFSFSSQTAGDSPATSSDSGYGSEKERVRDVCYVEKEKGVKDWELYSNAWDDDEVMAWESSF